MFRLERVGFVAVCRDSVLEGVGFSRHLEGCFELIPYRALCMSEFVLLLRGVTYLINDLPELLVFGQIWLRVRRWQICFAVERHLQCPDQILGSLQILAILFGLLDSILVLLAAGRGQFGLIEDRLLVEL